MKKDFEIKLKTYQRKLKKIEDTTEIKLRFKYILTVGIPMTLIWFVVYIIFEPSKILELSVLIFPPLYVGIMALFTFGTDFIINKEKSVRYFKNKIEKTQISMEKSRNATAKGI